MSNETPLMQLLRQFFVYATIVFTLIMIASGILGALLELRASSFGMGLAVGLGLVVDLDGP